MLAGKKILALLAASILLSACGGTPKITKNTESNGKPAFKIEGSGDTLKESNAQLAIASFRVIFITEGQRRQAAENTGRWGSSGDVSSVATVKTILSGVDSDLMQNITDAAYQNFTNSLTEKGFELVSMDQVVNNAEFKKLDKRANGQIDSSLKTVGKLFVDNKEDITQYPTYSPSGLPLLDPSFLCIELAPLYDNLCLTKVADNLGVPVVHVNYVVDFSSFDSSADAGRNFLTNSNFATAEVTTGQHIHLNPNESGIKIIGKSGNSLALILDEQNPFQTSQAFGESVDATSTTDKAVSGFANVMGFLGGVSGGKTRSNSTATYEMKAQPEVYQEMVNNMLTASSKEIAWSMEYFRDTQ